MDSDRSDFGKTPTDEPDLTQKNSATVRGEETLASDGRPRKAAVPSYGAAGDTTDAYEEGAGQADADQVDAGGGI